MDYVEIEVESLPIDDVATLIKFYDDYHKTNSMPSEIKELSQKKDHFDYYLNGVQYTFHSENAVKLVNLIANNNPQGKLDAIKEKILHREAREEEFLKSTIRSLQERLNRFFESRLNF